MIEQTIDISTKDGATTTFIVHPDRGGPHPLIIFYMDAPAIREELRDMARRLASAGYYVMLPNLYYRAGVLELGPLSPDPSDPGRARMFELMNGLSIAMVMEDTDALVEFAKGQAAASTKKIGCVGYCMSGQFAINAAARHADKVAAAASIYGTFLVTDKSDSPHLAARKAKGELYFACAEIDRWAPLETVQALDQSLAADKINAEVELYPKVEHGFAFPQRAAYDKTSAERHWQRLNALFARNL
ncbi:hydrolase [Phenylobacterium sp. Root77]|uniref:dienelactone hydrolase family protein n=1 Tax=unclassified Phenylobacterium TaxID=2640670 RepID=UPI0006F7977F|nr:MULTISPECIES: dienelactone hydrolase family protein [unclassified Phenylobacterium]KQW66484.1 hydrolase [Phenylobacterium sp. Root1277]KQW88990.1 hydrolase [Phenylobacterium sp. Root1290]KRC42154.1 hydrolase [Phenylobacterium sp. Root77]